VNTATTIAVQAELETLFDPRFLAHRERDLARFTAWGAEHERDATLPRILEIGANTGAFLVGQALSNPDTRVLGIEWKQKHCRLAEDRFRRRACANAEVLFGDAKMAIPLIIPPESLDAVFVLFPDPWWKARHSARRLLDGVFLRVLARRLKPGGRLYVKSDVFDYLVRLRAFAEKSGAFVPLQAHDWPDERGWTWSTREKKSMNGAIPFGRSYWLKNPAFDSTLPMAPENPADYEIDEDIDSTALIKGPPPVDLESRRQQEERRKADQA
jgi:tRNA (guanine-N7-)-methyltransferase